jgi:replication-associated recombination protein RarA
VTTERFKVTTKSGHLLSEVASAFQKSIRRGLEDEALHWGVELDVSNFGEYAWKRMRIMASEDVGLAEPHLPAAIHALYQNWVDQRRKRDLKHGPERLFLIHGILLLVRARKSRIVDHALITYYGNHEVRPIPDYALDKHTGAGRRMGRGVEHFFDVGIQLANKADLPDEYERTARETMLKIDRRGTADRETLFDDEG